MKSLNFSQWFSYIAFKYKEKVAGLIFGRSSTSSHDIQVIEIDDS